MAMHAWSLLAGSPSSDHVAPSLSHHHQMIIIWVKRRLSERVSVVVVLVRVMPNNLLLLTQ